MCPLALAEIGRKVLLIDTDLCKPRLHEIFYVSIAWGLGDLLDGTKPPEGLEAMVGLCRSADAVMPHYSSRPHHQRFVVAANQRVSEDSPAFSGRPLG